MSLTANQVCRKRVIGETGNLWCRPKLNFVIRHDQFCFFSSVAANVSIMLSLKQDHRWARRPTYHMCVASDFDALKGP